MSIVNTWSAMLVSDILTMARVCPDEKEIVSSLGTPFLDSPVMEDK